ncbi:hypothetical protein MKX03_016578, partial [Papaver bracteatum]
MEKKHSFLCLLSILIVLSAAAPLCSANLDETDDLRLPSDANAEAVAKYNDQVEPKKIVGKRFMFPNVADSGVLVHDLGHHAGYYKLQHSHVARMFYFFFESRSNKNDPVVIWLTGGPGCSSELAVFYENVPFTIGKNFSSVLSLIDLDLILQVSNLFYVDQPTGNGFSYSSSRDLRHNEEGAFFAEHPQYAKNDFYIPGESYVGHYIPAFAARVHQGNKSKEGLHINLKLSKQGFSIGNGLTEPAIQYKAYTDFVLDNGLIKQSDYTSIPRSYCILMLCCNDSTKMQSLDFLCINCVTTYPIRDQHVPYLTCLPTSFFTCT